MPKTMYKDILYDSLEEACIAAWLAEAFDHGLMLYSRQVPYVLTPKYYRTEVKQLKTKTKVVKKTLVQPCTYTADFLITSKVPINGIYCAGCWIDGYIQESDQVAITYVIDVKGEGGKHDTQAKFSNIQKMMIARCNTYVNKVTVGEFFCNNGWPAELPAECYMQNGGLYAWLRKWSEKDHRTIKDVFNVH